jgi:hypothetical protein
MENKFIIFIESGEQRIGKIIYQDLNITEALTKIKENESYRYMPQKHINKYWPID